VFVFFYYAIYFTLLFFLFFLIFYLFILLFDHTCFHVHSILYVLKFFFKFTHVRMNNRWWHTCYILFIFVFFFYVYVYLCNTCFHEQSTITRCVFIIFFCFILLCFFFFFFFFLIWSHLLTWTIDSNGMIFSTLLI
jgi:hypothetical protein